MNLEKKVTDVGSINDQLRLQLKKQEEETVKAMKAIETQIELETEKVVKISEEEQESLAMKNKKEIAHIEKEYKTRISDLKQEKG